MSLLIRLSLDVWCEDSEPGQYIAVYEGEILGSGESVEDDDDIDVDEPTTRVGKIHLYLVDRARILNERESLYEVMDDVSSETMECFEAIIDVDTGDLKEEVSDLISGDALFLHNILLINRLELDVRFRGRGIGERVVEEVIRQFGSNCAVITCKPFALQYEGRGTPETEKERRTAEYRRKRREAFAKVAGFWKERGFRKLPSSDHYVWSYKAGRNRRRQ